MYHRLTLFLVLYSYEKLQGTTSQVLATIFSVGSCPSYSCKLTVRGIITFPQEFLTDLVPQKQLGNFSIAGTVRTIDLYAEDSSNHPAPAFIRTNAWPDRHL